MDSRKIVMKETGMVAIGVAACTALMLVVYALLNAYSTTVLLSGLFGALLTVANFFFMAVGSSLAADKAQDQDVNGGKKVMKISMLLRLAVLGILLFALLKSGICEPLPLLLPLVFVRPVLMLGEFFGKKEG